MVRAPWEITLAGVLSEAEADQLLRRVREKARTGEPSDILDRVIVEGLMFSGLRCSEFCALTLADLQISARASNIVVRGKSAEGRTVHIGRDVADLLREYVRSTRGELLAANLSATDPQGPLIVNERGKAYERTGLYRRVVAILTDAGLGAKASVQLLRHTYGFLAYLRTGGNLLFVQRQLGHSHPMITAAYAELVQESYTELADQVSLTTQAISTKLPKSVGKTKRAIRFSVKQGD